MINAILKRFNLRLVNNFPRPSIKFAKEYFKKNINVTEVGVFMGENAESMLKELDIKNCF